MLHIPILLRAAVLGGAVLLPFAPVAQAQSGAEKALSAQPFSIVAPFPPGGPVDVLSRILATGLNERYKQAAVVDNRTGANGNIGIDLVKRAAPTGHTLLVVPAGNLTINPTLMPKLGYSVIKLLAAMEQMRLKFPERIPAGFQPLFDT